MKYSCADFTFPLLPHDKTLQLIKLLGIHSVDLGLFEDRSHHYPSQIARDPQGQASLIKEKLSALELSVADVFLQTGAEPHIAAANTPDDGLRQSNRDTFARILEYTHALGCRHLTGLPGVMHKNVDHQTDWQRAAEESAWRVAQANDAGIIYAIEPHVGSILPDPDKAMAFLRQVPGLSLTLDYGHFIYQGMPNESVHPLIPHASHFHARGGAPGMLQSTVKDNTIDFETILHEFKELDYPGYICLEYVYVDWEGCNRTDNVSETLLLQQLLGTYISNGHSWD